MVRGPEPRPLSASSGAKDKAKPFSGKNSSYRIGADRIQWIAIAAIETEKDNVLLHV